LGIQLRREVGMLINLDQRDKRPIYQQIEDQIVRLCLLEILKEGDSIPSVRQMAADLSINPNTVQKAYQELESKGVIVTVRGKGNFIGDISVIRSVRESQILLNLHETVSDALKNGIQREKVLSVVSEIYDEKESLEKDHIIASYDNEKGEIQHD
jgi:GntR family transcriptional regulator